MPDNKFKDLLKLLRVKSWIKNLLIFLPSLCGRNLVSNRGNAFVCIWGFLLMCLLSSTVYIINDIQDIDLDRENPRKINEPLPSGRISVNTCVKLLIGTTAAEILLAMVIWSIADNRRWWKLMALCATYLGINFCYSVLKFKKMPIIDMMIVVSGFLIRVVAGGVITGTKISSYLFLTILTISLYMISMKRRFENGTKSRPLYSKEWIKSIGDLSGILSMVFFSLWALDTFETDYTVLLIVGALVLYIIYSYGADKLQQGDPIAIIFGYKVIMIYGAIYSILLAVLLTFGHKM